MLIKKANHKPGSVFLVEKINAVVYHLSSTDVTISVHQPTLRDRTSSPQSSVYLVFQFVRFSLPPTSLPERWALTPPFHLFLDEANMLVRVVFLSAALSVPLKSLSKDLPVRKYDALYCPDFPLFRINETAID